MLPAARLRGFEYFFSPFMSSSLFIVSKSFLSINTSPLSVNLLGKRLSFNNNGNDLIVFTF